MDSVLPRAFSVPVGFCRKLPLSVCVGSPWLCGLPQWCSGKEAPCNAGDAGDVGSVTALERSPAGGHGNPL